MMFSIKYFFSKCDQIRSKLRIRLHLLEKSLMENFIFCAVSCEKQSEATKISGIVNMSSKNLYMKSA